MIVKYKRLDDKVEAPKYGSENSAGVDLRVVLDDDITISPGEIKILQTGIACEIPNDFFGMICSRSGLAAKNGIVILNSPGIIDSDYRGEIKLIVINHSSAEFIVRNGMRLAQLVIVPYAKACWVQSDNFCQTKRSTGGLGSTGIE